MIYEVTKERFWYFAAAAAAVYLLTPGKKTQTEARDFDSFLVVQNDVPTGAVRSGGGPFEEFLIDSDERDSVVFETFLKSHGSGAKPTMVKKVAEEAIEELPEPHMTKVVVMFGTEYGFSKEVADKLASQMKEDGKFWPVLVDMAEHGKGYDFTNVQAALVVCSTQGDGVPPTEARPFCEWLFAGNSGPLANLNFSVCALGDKSYTHFCKCGKTIDASLEAAGANRIAAHAEVDKENWPLINTWMSSVMSELPKLGLRSFSETGESIQASTKKDAGPRPWGKSRPYPAKVVALEGLCKVDSEADKNTIRIELDLGDSGLTYLPGDALGIYPFNAPSVVQDLIAALGVPPSYEVQTPSFHYEEAVHYIGSSLSKGSKAPLVEVLTKCFDLRSPKASIFDLVSETPKPTANGHAKGHTKKPANGNTNGCANGITHPPSLSELKSDAVLCESYLSQRHVADILRDFPAAKLSPEALLGALRQLQPRLYSISSSPLEGSSKVQATIAEVKYSCLGKERIGVCSTLVADRIEPGQEVPVYIHHNPDFRLPSSSSTPIIMVGPGTGLAPFRSFILERLLQEKPDPTEAKAGEMVLFFGCRRSDQDYLYGDVLEQWRKDGDITLFTAFSRQQTQKVYVQDRLQESAELVWSLLNEKGGHFYVCGDAGSMAGAVELVLLKIIADNLKGGDATTAQKYLDEMSSTGRYQRDVWFS
eukprot:gene23032-30226_t